MSNKFTCSFPEFNFPNLLLKGIEKLQRKVRCISSDHCSKQIWVYRAVTFSSHKQDCSNNKTKTHEQLCKAHPPPLPAPILCLCLLILEDTKTPRAEGKWNYLIYGHFLAFAEPRWKYKIKKTNKQTNKQTKKCCRSQIMTLGCLCPKAGEMSNKSC